MSELQIYNTRSRQKENFVPIEPGKVGLYVCGMTVYDHAHVGHARVMVFFDVVVKHLRALGFKVHYVRNITDIDDKIIKRANENGEDFRDLVERYVQALNEDTAALGIEPPDQEPRATTSMDDILSMTQTLIDRGHAYAANNGDVYFDVSSFSEYGKLSGKNLDDLQAGARVEVGEIKQDPVDFALWKSAKPDEPSWSSPWGEGRPGWHIECSAMSTRCLGNHFDIHGGGLDLVFPHHENEVAQSECATGESFVNTWMHVGFVRVDDEKMSKSLNNFFTIREVLAQYSAEVIRLFLLTSHYRSPLNYTRENLDNAVAGLTRLYTALRGVEESTAPAEHALRERFEAAMNDDFNTPEALAVLYESARELNKLRESKDLEAPAVAGLLRELGARLGLLQGDAEAFLRGESTSDEDAEIEALILARNNARASKDWAEADRIRDELAARKIILEDAAGVTTWRRG
jgi:cysteinyl-tRNA synthetase